MVTPMKAIPECLPVLDLPEYQGACEPGTQQTEWQEYNKKSRSNGGC